MTPRVFRSPPLPDISISCKSPHQALLGNNDTVCCSEKAPIGILDRILTFLPLLIFLVYACDPNFRMTFPFLLAPQKNKKYILILSTYALYTFPVFWHDLC